MATTKAASGSAAPMTKKMLVEKVAAATGWTNKESKEGVEAVFDEIAKGIKSHKKVAISGFGNFELKKRAKRQGVNPKTGEKVTIPAKTVLKFRPLKALKDATLGAPKK